MTIDNKLLTRKPREESGSKTSRKYSFQKDLSLYLLIKEHAKRDDYLFLFDFHEDLIISSTATSLKELEFFQIKSKDKGNWTITDLTKQGKGKNSIIGKLYHNRIVFENEVKSLIFISNSPYSFKNLKNGSDSRTQSEILADNLSNEDKELCNRTIATEHSIKEIEFEKLAQFKVTSLSNTESSTHCVGALAALINSINPSSKINSQLAYEQVYREITRKTNETVSDKNFKHISEIINIKGLSKNEFIQFLHKAGLYRSVEEEWIEVKTSLELDGTNHLELMKFKKGWRDMCARLISDSSSIPLRKLRNEISDIIDREEESIKTMKLTKIIEHIYRLLSYNSHDEYFIKCLIINCINES